MLSKTHRPIAEKNKWKVSTFSLLKKNEEIINMFMKDIETFLEMKNKHLSSTEKIIMKKSYFLSSCSLSFTILSSKTEKKYPFYSL